ncbi:MAG TPA: EAL domain-containing protein [Noviherbaspirillum sp.]|uniref:putative bifunctional diguanylate cyclase/phosphodiesterase n=1 Tax=Noviherbaspirillum sp. TaxID=1926288 RepID=UPI002D6240F1|nr:EAL domain-containing protein [Noviherbaspirillum sp.]HYD94374.1 EAL domain-containing protein [Noviherbaspirillum sp.]
MDFPGDLHSRERIARLPRGRIGAVLAVCAIAALLVAQQSPYWLLVALAAALGAIIFLGNASRLPQADHGLRESERKFRNFVEQSLVGLYVVQDGKIAYANSKSADLLGFDSPEQLIGVSVSSLTYPDDVPVLEENHRRRLNGEVNSIRYTYRALRRDGRILWVDVQGSLCQYDGRPAIMGVALDVSQQVAFEHQSRLANRVFDSASEGIVITDAECRIEAVNPAFTRITGYAAHEALGRLSRMMTGTGAELNQDMLSHLARDGHWQGEMRDRRKNGEWYPAWLSISTVRDADRNITNYVGVFTDNTRRKEDETRLQFLASHDSLTGMWNRSGMMTRFALEIERARAAGRQLAVLFIDLDRFKTVNDTLGHLAGDQLLVAAAGRMRAQLKQGDMAARLGGDEFTVLLDDPPSSGAAADLAERLINSMGQPFSIGGQEMFVTASIGIACYPADGHDAATLLKNADVAMYRAKQRGKNTFQFFTSDMNTQAFEQLLLENSLRRALERSEFELHYQPQFSAATGRVSGVEALVRWRHPELGLVLPGTFISLAEQNGLIVPIGAWVLQEACRQGRVWMDAGHDFGRIAVNLSAKQFASGNLLDVIRAALDGSRLPPSKLELEITESTIMQNPAEAVLLLDRIRDMGVALSIDDFGTGYSSLVSLKQYPLDSLKIDRGFVKGIPHDADDIAITEAIIAIAHKMRLKVVAEGVETREQADFLRTAGCSALQGFLLGRPVPAAELERKFGFAEVTT